MKIYQSSVPGFTGPCVSVDPRPGVAPLKFRLLGRRWWWPFRRVPVGPAFLGSPDSDGVIRALVSRGPNVRGEEQPGSPARPARSISARQVPRVAARPVHSLAPAPVYARSPGRDWKDRSSGANAYANRDADAAGEAIGKIVEDAVPLVVDAIRAGVEHLAERSNGPAMRSAGGGDFGGGGAHASWEAKDDEERRARDHAASLGAALVQSAPAWSEQPQKESSWGSGSSEETTGNDSSSDTSSAPYD